MYDLKGFRERVHDLYRRSDPYLGRRPIQADLAASIGLSVGELNRRLRGTGKTTLTEQDARAIVRTLAMWSAITSQAEAAELLTLLGCPPFSQAEWQASPLDLLSQTAPQPLTVAPMTGTNLPFNLTSFVGREVEQAEVGRLLAKSRLLTLTGMGGCGKTRLALQAASGLLEDYAGAVYLVELAALRDPALLPQYLAAALKLREQPGQPLLETLVTHLQQRMLLIFDNCEHLVAAVADLLLKLLNTCAKLRVLTTSREVLKIPGEVVLRLAPLAFPPAAATTTAEQLSHYPATKLFLERAEAILPGFSSNLADHSAGIVQRICQQLEGFPLAIELAAARTSLLSLADIEVHLSDRFQLLAAGARSHLPRQRTLTALLDWSYDLLSDEEQVLFCSLSVFAGSFDLAGIAALQDEGRGRLAGLELLGGLVDKSLVERDQQSGSTRYRLLETLRQYAALLLSKDGAEQLVRQRHAHYYGQLAEEGEAGLRSAEQLTWLQRLTTEHSNLTAALDWSLEHDPETGLRLAVGLIRFWQHYGNLSEGNRYLQAVLSLEVRAEHKASRAKALNGLGNLAEVQSDYTTSISCYEQALQLWQELDNKAGLAVVQGNLGNIQRSQGNYPAARSYYAQSLRLYTELDDQWGIAVTSTNLGDYARMAGDYATAYTYLSASLSAAKELGDKRSIVNALSGLGLVASIIGEQEQGWRLLEQALVLARELNSKRLIAYALTNRGVALYLAGDYLGLLDLYAESLRLFWEQDDKVGVAYTLVATGMGQVLVGNVRRGGFLMGAGSKLYSSINAVIEVTLRTEYARVLAVVTAEPGSESFVEFWVRGQGYKLETGNLLELTQLTLMLSAW